MNNYDNFNEETTDEIMDELSHPARNISKKGAKKTKKAIKKKIAQATTKIAKAIGKALLSIVKVLLPYFLVFGIILLIAVLSYFILFEFTGTEKEYIKEYENEITKTENGTYKTSESQMNLENKTVRDFYRYFAGQSFWKLVGQDNDTLYSPDEKPKINGKEVEVKDEYDREKLFNLNSDLLYSLDEYMYNWKYKYPEQFIKPVNYDKNDLTLKPLTDENGIVIVESEKEDIETGEKTGEKFPSVRDYGLGSILKYNEKDDYKITRRVKGEYIAEDVWNDETKQVEKVIFDNPLPFEFVMDDYPMDIWLIDKAILFTGEIEYEYEYQEEKFDDLKTGVSEKENEAVTEIIYKYEEVQNCKTLEFTNPSTGLVEEHEICDEPIIYELKRYRSDDSAVFEEKPVVVNTIIEDKEKDYLNDYLHNFESYIPIDVIDEFNFKDRIDYDSYVFDYEGFNLGDATDTDGFKEISNRYLSTIREYSKDFGVDPYIILAMIAQESGGDPNVKNGNGLAQITDEAGETVTAVNIYGVKETFTVKKEERTDPEKSIKYLVMKYKYILDMMDGNPYKAIQTYNFGPGTMSEIKKIDPVAWDTEYDWLIYREAARRKRALDNRPSASYSCMEFPEGEIISEKDPWGNSCHLENVLRYYAGNEIDDLGTTEDSSTGKPKKSIKTALGSFFKKFVIERKKNELIPKYDFENHVKQTRVSDVLMTAKALNDEILFSEAMLDESGLTNFWDDDFMDLMASSGLNLQDILNIAPNSEGYLPPIALGNGIAVTSLFGPRKRPCPTCSEYHLGVDVGAPEGTPVYSVASGEVVTQISNSESAGNYLEIDHGNGVLTRYLHLSKFCVNKGDIVEQGQEIGKVGKTGKGTGAHLHFEFRVNGVPKDPIGIILGE